MKHCESLGKGTNDSVWAAGDGMWEMSSRRWSGNVFQNSVCAKFQVIKIKWGKEEEAVIPSHCVPNWHNG